MKDESMVRTFALAAGATLLFALSHSLLATQWMKDQVEALLGRRARDGLYRFAYVNISALSLAAMAWSLARLPDRVVYRVPRPWSLIMRAGQLMGVWLMLDTNWRMGVGRFTGLSGVWELVSGREPEREPPAQGPLLEDGAPRPGGAFGLSRHPNNLGPTMVVCLQPTMNVRLLTFAVIGGLYAFFGSMLEERRARTAYGARYDDYRARTPFFFPLSRLQSRR